MATRRRPDEIEAPPAAPRYRSAAVARMVRMPVATLRIWERRYGVVSPQTSPAGHRLYSAEQVQRLALLKQLTDLGHAIGELARLDSAALEQVAATHAQAMARSQGHRPATPWRVTLVDACGVTRWQPAALALPRPLSWVSVFDDLLALADRRRRRGEPASDALIVVRPSLLAEDVPLLRRAARACGAGRLGVRHGFTSREVARQLREAGVSLLREPADDAAVTAWLRDLAQPAAPEAVVVADRPDPVWTVAASAAPGPRRYDDATLTAFAQLSSTIACECPRHVAELLLQLSQFEAYSAECGHRSAEDAALHRYLQQVAASARGLFEAALERVAEQEGLMVPQAAPPRR